MMAQNNELSQTAPNLSAVEQKLLKQVQANVKPKPKWVKFLANTLCGLWY